MHQQPTAVDLMQLKMRDATVWGLSRKQPASPILGIAHPQWTVKTGGVERSCRPDRSRASEELDRTLQELSKSTSHPAVRLFSAIFGRAINLIWLFGSDGLRRHFRKR